MTSTCSSAATGPRTAAEADRLTTGLEICDAVVRRVSPAVPTESTGRPAGVEPAGPGWFVDRFGFTARRLPPPTQLPATPAVGRPR